MKVMAIFEIPEHERIGFYVTPTVHHQRLLPNGNASCYSTPVKLIECPEEFIHILESHNVNWKHR